MFHKGHKIILKCVECGHMQLGWSCIDGTPCEKCKGYLDVVGPFEPVERIIKEGCDPVKHGKKPTVKQTTIIKKSGLNQENWYIIKNLPDELHIAHRETGWMKVIPMERR